MTYNQADIIEIIRTRNWSKALGVILSCTDFLERVKFLNSIHEKKNIISISTTDIKGAIRWALKEFQKGKGLDSLTIPGLKGEPITGNIRIIMIDNSDVISADFEETRERLRLV